MLTPAIIDLVVMEMCQHLAQIKHFQIDRHNPERDFLYHLAVCILGTQTRYEVAVTFADTLVNCDLLTVKTIVRYGDAYEEQLALVFSRSVGFPNVQCLRFKNRSAKQLAAALRICGEQGRFIDVMREISDPQCIRKWLVDHVDGLGPKQASLFLRRIGYSNDLAVIDRHIMNYLNLVEDYKFPYSKLSRLSGYIQVEERFRAKASQFQQPVGVFDLAVWITMRVVGCKLSI